MNDKNNDQLKSTETSSALWKLWNEWRIFLWGFFRPLVIIPLVVTVVSLIIANKKDVDKTLSLVLQIVAALLAAIAGKFFYDVIRNVFESNILIKKGLSAVRNLALARTKTNNISDRVKANALAEEIRNLLSLLEKDIANATQEWNDILPGVDKLEIVYTLLAEKESELEHVERQREQLDKQSKETRELSEIEKKRLSEEIAEKEKKISDLSYEISRLRLRTEPVTSTASGIGSFPIKLTFGSPQPYQFFKTCSECKKTFLTSDLNQEKCNECQSKSGSQ